MLNHDLQIQLAAAIVLIFEMNRKQNILNLKWFALGFREVWEVWASITMQFDARSPNHNTEARRNYTVPGTLTICLTALIHQSATTAVFDAVIQE